MLGLERMDLAQVEDVRIGNHICLGLKAEKELATQDKVNQACRKLLANLIMASYAFCLVPINSWLSDTSCQILNLSFWFPAVVQ